jgi:hypothetical protein
MTAALCAYLAAALDGALAALRGFAVASTG